MNHFWHSFCQRYEPSMGFSQNCLKIFSLKLLWSLANLAQLLITMANLAKFKKSQTNFGEMVSKQCFQKLFLGSFSKHQQSIVRKLILHCFSVQSAYFWARHGNHCPMKKGNLIRTRPKFWPTNRRKFIRIAGNGRRPLLPPEPEMTTTWRPTRTTL